MCVCLVGGWLLPRHTSPPHYYYHHHTIHRGAKGGKLAVAPRRHTPYHRNNGERECGTWRWVKKCAGRAETGFPTTHTMLVYVLIRSTIAYIYALVERVLCASLMKRSSRRAFSLYYIGGVLCDCVVVCACDLYSLSRDFRGAL